MSAIMRKLNPYQQSRLDRAFIRAFREDARTKQQNYCFYCEEPLTAHSCTADHVKPKYAFGLDHRNNIVAACEACNKLKGNMSDALFEKKMMSPSHEDDLEFFLLWSRKRINHRLRRMKRYLGVK